VLLAAQHAPGPDPINVGTGSEIRVSELAALIAELVGFEGRIAYDAGKPDGQPRRCLDTTRAWDLLGFRAHVALREGLAETVRWYLESGRGAARGAAA
jgi:GDP-L-fucose synthase